MRWLDSNIDSMDMNLRKRQEMVKDREAWCVLQSIGLQRVGHNIVTEEQQQILPNKIFPFSQKGMLRVMPVIVSNSAKC